MQGNLEAKFHEEMKSLYHETGKAIGYWPARFLQKVRRAGGLQAAREWLKPEPALPAGLQHLARKGRLDLSMEQLILRDPWKRLFTEQELEQAKKRLEAAENLFP